MDECSGAELTSTADDLSQYGGRLSELIKAHGDLGLRQVPIYGTLLTHLETSNSHLSSIAEGLRMSLNDDFGKMITEAAEELRSVKHGPERSSLIGHM